MKIFQINNLKENGLHKKIMIGIMDVLSIAFSFFAALWIRFDFHLDDIPPEFMQGYVSTIWIWCAVCVVAFAIAKLYNSIWTFVSTDEMFRVIMTYVVLVAVGLGLSRLLGLHMPRSYYALGFLLSGICTTMIRFSYRLLRQLAIFLSHLRNHQPQKNVMLIGSGSGVLFV